MQTPIIWGESETSYIRRFMDGVDKVVTDEMQSGRSLYLKRVLPQKNVNVFAGSIVLD